MSLLAVFGLYLSATVGHVHLIGGHPISGGLLPFAVPVSVYHAVLPILLTLGVNMLLRVYSAPAAGSVLAAALGLVSLASIWLQDLARHDGLLSGFQALLLIATTWPYIRRMAPLQRYLTSLVSALVLGIFTYGAVYGETRCEQITHVRCHTTQGPTVWVPHILEKLGFPPFARLRHADLANADLAGLDLRYADLAYADLSRASLVGARLRRANLEQVQAGKANLHSAYLDGAALAGADLRAADLRRVHAYRVDLSHSDLRGAAAAGASFSHSDFSMARLQGMHLQGSYLRFTQGLTQAQLSEACGTAETRLPPGLDIPPCC